MRTALLPLVALATVALAACSNGNASRPGAVASGYGSTTRSAALPSETPAVRIGTIDGASGRAVRNLRDALTASLQRRGIEVVKTRGPAVAELTGRMSAMNEGNVTTYTYEWRVADGRGWSAKPLTGLERTRGATSDLWSGVRGQTAERIGERVARRIALSIGMAG